MGRLDVRVVEARNLPSVQTFGEIDPYAIVTLEHQTHKTEVQSNTTTPKWDQVFKFTVGDANSSQLKIEVWNGNTASDDFLGQYSLSLGGLVRGQVQDSWHLLQQCKSNAEIRLRVCAIDFGADPPTTAAPPYGQQQQQGYPPAAPLGGGGYYYPPQQPQPTPIPPPQPVHYPPPPSYPPTTTQPPTGAEGFNYANYNPTPVTAAATTGGGNLYPGVNPYPPAGPPAPGSAEIPEVVKPDPVAPPPEKPPQEEPVVGVVIGGNGGPLVEGAIYEIEPRHAPGMRVDVSGGKKANGTKIQLWGANGTPAQQFIVRQQGSGVYSFGAMCSNNGQGVIDNGGKKGKQCHLWSHGAQIHPNGLFNLSLVEGEYYHVSQQGDPSHRWDCSGSGTGNGTQLFTYPGHHHPNQQFRFIRVGGQQPPQATPLEEGAIYEIEPRHAPGMRVDVSGGKKENGTKIQLWGANGTPAQQFIVRQQGSGVWSFGARCSNDGQGVIDNSGKAGNQCHLWSHGAQIHPNGLFNLTHVDGEYYHVSQQGDPSHRWDCSGSGKGNGTKLLTWQGHHHPNQQFRFILISRPTQPPAPVPELEEGAIYEIEPRHSPGMRVDVSGGKKDNGTKIQLWGANGTPAQQFIVWQQAKGVWSFGAMCSNDGQGVIDNSGQKGKQCHLWSHGPTIHPNGLFNVTHVDGEYFHVSQQGDPSHRWDCSGAGKKNGTPLLTWQGHHHHNQQFRFILKKPSAGIPLKNGQIYEIEPRHAPGMRVDVSNAGNSNGTKLQLWAANSTPAQRFICRFGRGVTCFQPLCAMDSFVDTSGSPQKQCHLWVHKAPHPNFLWSVTFVAEDHRFCRVESLAHRGFVWDCSGAGKGNGTQLITWKNDNHQFEHRQFRFIPI